MPTAIWLNKMRSALEKTSARLDQGLEKDVLSLLHTAIAQLLRTRPVLLTYWCSGYSLLKKKKNWAAHLKHLAAVIKMILLSAAPSSYALLSLS